MTQYDGPVFVQPEEAGDDAEAALERRRPLVATVAAALAAISMLLLALQLLNIPYLFEARAGEAIPELRAMASFMRVGWAASTGLAIVLALVALARREDGRLRIGIVLGIGASSLAWALLPYVGAVLREAA